MLMMVMLMMIMAVVAVIVVMMIVVVLFDRQEFRLNFQDTVEIEGVAAEHGVEFNGAFGGAVQLGVGVDAANARLDLFQFGRRDQIDLVEQDDVGEGDLVFRFRRVLEAGGQPFGVGDGDNRIESRILRHVGVDEKGLGDRGGIGEAGGFDQNGIELALAAHQAFDDADEVSAHGAADAAVVHFENFFVGVHDQIVVDADFAEFIDDHREFPAVILGENAVEQSGLARAEIAGEDGDGDFLIGHAVSLSSGASRLLGASCSLILCSGAPM